MNLLKQLFGREKPLDNDEVVKLSRMLIDVFSLDELRDLCAKLGVRFEYLSGESKAAKAKELVLYYSQLPRTIDEFIQACSQLYPNIPWNNPGSIESQPPNRDRVSLLLQLINYCFNVNELRDLCLDLEIDYENLPGVHKSGKVRELVSYYSRYPRNADQLSQVCSKLRPNAPWNEQKITKYEPYSTSALVKLRSLLMDHFDEEAVRKLSNNMEIDYKRLPGADQGKTAKELILYLARRERLNELVDACSHQFPEIPWQETLDLPDEQRIDEAKSEPVEPTRLRQNLLTLSEAQLRDLCFELGMDYEDIAGSKEVSELVSYFERRGRIPELVKTSMRLHPDRQW